MSRIIIKDTNGKRKEIKFLHNVKCDHCHKWLDDYAYELTTKYQPNIESNYCGGHTPEEVELSKKLKRGEMNNLTMKNKIKYIKPLNGTKPFGGFKCPRQLIAVSETGTYFLSLHPNYQAQEDAGEIGWAEYSLRPFFAFIYKLKNDVEIDLNKITFSNWEEYVGDVFGNPTENVETIFEDNEGDRYWDYRKHFEKIATK